MDGDDIKTSFFCLIVEWMLWNVDESARAWVRQAFVKKKCLGEKLKALFFPVQMNRPVSAVFTTDHPGEHKAFGSAVRNQRERERWGERERILGGGRRWRWMAAWLNSPVTNQILDGPGSTFFPLLHGPSKFVYSRNAVCDENVLVSNPPFDL